MNNELSDTIKQVDFLIKQGDFKSAWKLLLPYKDDPMARKRLIWLNQKRQQIQGAKQQRNTVPNSRHSRKVYLFTVLIMVLLLGVLAVYLLSRQYTASPTVAMQETPITFAAASVAASDIQPTNVPPTEVPQEASLQQQMKDWLTSIDGVEKVLTLDLDIPTDESPMVYSEILAGVGHNDTRIPDKFMQKIIGTLNTAQLSDFVMIINDDQKVIEYRFDYSDGEWQLTELASNIEATATTN